MKASALNPSEIRGLIYQIRGKAVMVDWDLAGLYQVDTRTLNQAVKRNLTRFPEDFMFQLTETEMGCLRSQFVISNKRGGRRYHPYAFTEEGVAMLSTVLKSGIAIRLNVQIMRAFVQMRRIGLTYHELKRKIDELERKYDRQFKVVFNSLRDILEPPALPVKLRKMGFSVS